jgi:hypothetical protein
MRDRMGWGGSTEREGEGEREREGRERGIILFTHLPLFLVVLSLQVDLTYTFASGGYVGTARYLFSLQVSLLLTSIERKERKRKKERKGKERKGKEKGWELTLPSFHRHTGTYPSIPRVQS